MKKYFGLDGGASSTRAIIIDSNGKTLVKKKINKGTNLKVYQDLAPKRIVDLINELCQEISISVDEISAFGFGLAAVSYDEGRELLFKELDRINVADRSILISDAEAAYKISCQDDVGILLTVGTGVICIGKNSDGEFIRVAGKGHDASDVGSGYWIGKEVLLKLSFNESIINHDPDLLQLKNIVFEKFESNNLNEALQNIADSEDSLSLKASLAKDVINISEDNEIALSILQEATFNVADYIVDLYSMLDYEKTHDLVLFGNGSVIKSPIYRKSINDSLSFQFKNISWVFSDISAAYGSAIIAAISKDKVLINVKDIIKGDYLVSS
jgi:N-acetylglucosamine kinase-like BadF-type ATPase